MAHSVYGTAIRDAQTCFLNRVPACAKVLIIGGGTGWLLAELLLRKPGCEVWYVDSSARMLDMSRHLNPHANAHFIRSIAEALPCAEFDVVIIHFFLDMFPEAGLQRLIPSIYSATKPSALWLVADFVDEGKWWQKALLCLMYLFFRAICRIQAKKLPSWDTAMLQAGLTKILARHFCGGFIQSAAYCRAKVYP